MPFASSFWKNIAPYLVLQVVGVIMFIIGFALFTPGVISDRPEWDEIHLWCGVLEVSGFVFLLVGTTGAGIAACRYCHGGNEGMHRQLTVPKGASPIELGKVIDEGLSYCIGKHVIGSNAERPEKRKRKRKE